MDRFGIVDALFKPSVTAEQAPTGVLKILVAWSLYLGSLSLHDVLQLIGLFLGCVYTGTQTYLLWRDKVLKKKQAQQLADTQH